MTLTGAQIDRCSSSSSAASTRRPHPTPGSSRSCSRRPGSPTPGRAQRRRRARSTATRADAVDPASITLNGVPVDPAATYRVTVNTFLADGGDGFLVLRDGTDRLGGPVDLDAFEAYLASTEPGGLTPPALDRIDQVA